MVEFNFKLVFHPLQPHFLHLYKSINGRNFKIFSVIILGLDFLKEPTSPQEGHLDNPELTKLINNLLIIRRTEDHLPKNNFTA